MTELTIPKEWTKANIEDLISEDGVFCDGDWIETEDQNPKGDVRLIQLADIGDGYFRDRSNRFLTSRKAEEIRCTYLQKGDILVARMPDPLGRACIFPLGSDRKYVTAVDVCIVRPNTKWLNLKYLAYLINSPRMRVEIEAFKSGTTRKRISRKNFGKILWPISPTSEQNKIAELIEELFSDLDNAIENLKKAKEQVRVYRQAVLKYAFDGTLNRTKSSSNKWMRKTIGEICITGSGGTPSRSNLKYFTGNIPWVKSGELDFNVIYDTEEKITQEALNNSSAKLVKKGTLLIALYGATVGKMAFLGIDAATNQAVCFIETPKYLIAKFLYYFLVLNRDILLGQRIGGAQPNISQTIIKNTLCPIPSVEEQDTIIKFIESCFSVCDKLEETIENSLKQAESLRQSILKQAFEGKLTEQWRKEHKDLISGENSAESLLKNIKAEKEALQVKPKGKKKHG
jgi:type I restriction enzyme S subunit